MKTAEIKYWLCKNDISQRDIAKAVNRAPSLVSMTINGERRNEAVIAFLKRYGCPDEYLGNIGTNNNTGGLLDG